MKRILDESLKKVMRHPHCPRRHSTLNLNIDNIPTSQPPLYLTTTGGSFLHGKCGSINTSSAQFEGSSRYNLLVLQLPVFLGAIKFMPGQATPSNVPQQKSGFHKASLRETNG